MESSNFTRTGKEPWCAPEFRNQKRCSSIPLLPKIAGAARRASAASARGPVPLKFEKGLSSSGQPLEPVARLADDFQKRPRAEKSGSSFAASAAAFTVD